MSTCLYPVLLCGGSGTRLWPLSRKSFPKQFARFGDGGTLFQAAAQRLVGPDVMPPVVITSADFRFIVTEQLSEAGIDPGPILIEPSQRNTAPAILAAVLHLEASNPEALLLVMPSDQVVPDRVAFGTAVRAGIADAAAGQIVTFGVRPSRAETGYGWLELDRQPGSHEPDVIDLRRFVEKPKREVAETMLADGRYLWNAGIFLMSVAAARKAFEDHAPQLLDPVRRAVAGAKADLGFLRLAAEPWAGAQDISVDYAVMERAANLKVVPFGGAWSDLGDWESVWRESSPDGDGLVTHGAVTAIDSRNSLLRSETQGLELVGIGLDNIIAVAMDDAVLVADKSRAQDVKQAVARLKAKGARQAETFPRDHRPWGWFETLVLADRFQVKRIVVHPGAALSLQSHVHRSEHWIVVAGTAKVTVNDTVQLLTENQSVYVPLGAVHRMENPGKVPMVLIEVQTGVYLGEDDIIRYDDVYSRGQGAKG
ncbi:MAG: mannose-1-phosphate guanylyltransferase/mannose-6-phosphate isomerase [Rhodobacter sp.]|nr:mannose-1-phosphate guanylyltransferase/mannose-6-phosphate isomerase [Rhodobacter sp.]MCA3519173.1 mannose-1-phosphate guanylyltransferase/mannose-6-phosphate isomerase [Rhodobacter sp.]MCA3523333.1 mannose-1-phosphate guanylyltransferase/mannose-6-phosphate isomerase [Rhodobacter sp.]MCA3526341.1 mannose-1-phosphate guanylyltransferase/mannose-6-phosphate isomerase [Rhodobacter sp.]MCA3528727.1 mannose-1-phosphate guanylyltransferase/mannose-6-phosphate isomerase [Rhodobacter sp.]